MKKRNILLLIILSFFVFLPFNVKAETIVRTENFQLMHNKDFSSTVINQLKSVIYYHFLQRESNACSNTTMDVCLDKFDIFVDYDESQEVFRVYYLLEKTTRFVSLNDSGIYFHFFQPKVLNVKVSDLSIVSYTSGSFTNFGTSGYSLYDILKNSNYVCIGDYYSNCGNTGLDDKTTRDVEFWKKYNLYNDGKFNYDNFDNLYVYSSIVWSNIDFKWQTDIYFKSLGNTNLSTYKAFSYNLDSEGSYSDTITTTKTILLDTSLYDSYELKFEVIGSKKTCKKYISSSIGLHNIPLGCLDWEYHDNYFINVYSKSMTNVKYYLSTDNKSWDKQNLNVSSDNEKYIYKDSNLNGKYGKYVFDLTSLSDVVLITISYDNTVLSFKTPELQIAEEDMTLLDLTGKYAVGLIPKNTSNPVPLYYQGNFVTYYSFGDTTSAYEYKLLNSTDHFSKYTIDFTNYNLNKPIFYILNTDYKTDSSSSIKYYSNYFDVVYFLNDYDNVTLNDFVYGPPSTSVDISTGDKGSGSSSSNDYSLGNVFSKLPSMILGMGTAFGAIGTCIGIAFSSLPELVQTVLIFSLIITILFIAIKFIRG